MNKIIIIGNLTRAPELRATKDGISVCTFTVAVNGHAKNGVEPEATFFRVTTWRGLADNCARFLEKGRKVAVSGSVSLNTYTGQDGQTRASIEINADEVEFLTPKGEATGAAPVQQRRPRIDGATGFQEVEDEDLPF